MTDTIKINREMLRKAFSDAKNRNTTDRFLEALELHLFGPPKPREWKVYLDPSGRLYEGEVIPGVSFKVREVLDQ